MSKPTAFHTELKAHRLRAGWSQEELARISGLSRAGVSAVETGRLIPSAAAALALAGALGCRVEDLFRLGAPFEAPAEWAWRSVVAASRYWRVDVGGVVRLYPAEPTIAGLVAHDGVANEPASADSGARDPRTTLVLAGCDPAAGFLAEELSREAVIRLLALPRSSRAALGLLAKDLVHAAGVHLAHDGRTNEAAARAIVTEPFHLLHIAQWEEGIAFAPSLRLASSRAAAGGRLRWVGREPGSAARQCLDELLEGRRAPRRIASDHRGVAEAIRQGWANAGVCIRLVGEEAGLGFLSLRRERYDLCILDRRIGDPRIQALIRAVRSPTFRSALGALPGYDCRETGEIQHVRTASPQNQRTLT
jgi:molybdate-binding protein/DNA-binding XRE family transcriptional regulator